MDIGTFGIESEWFTIPQDRQQWPAIHLSDNIVEVCVANRSSQQQTFSCKSSGDIIRHQPYCGTQHLDRGNLDFP